MQVSQILREEIEVGYFVHLWNIIVETCYLWKLHNSNRWIVASLIQYSKLWKKWDGLGPETPGLKSGPTPALPTNAKGQKLWLSSKNENWLQEGLPLLNWPFCGGEGS